jgi:hypothetical protein
MVIRTGSYDIEDLSNEKAFSQNGYEARYNEKDIANISKAIVSFLSLSNKISRPDIYSGTKDIPVKGVDPEFRKILRQEFVERELGTEEQRIQNVEEEKRFISPREFIKETAPKHWKHAHFQKSLTNWILKLTSQYGVVLDFDISIVHDYENEQAVIDINGNQYNIIESIEKWETIINNYHEDHYWKEVHKDEYIKIDGEETIKSIETILLNALTKNPSSRYHEFLWIAYKTCENFIIFRNDSRGEYRIFIKEADLLTSMKL